MNRDAHVHILMAIEALTPDVDGDEDALVMLDEVNQHLMQAQAILEDECAPKPKKRARKR